MKIRLLSVFIFSVFTLFAQDNPAYLLQAVDIKQYQNENFRIEGHLFIEDQAKNTGGLPIVIFANGDKILNNVFDRYSMESFKPGVWNSVEVSGKINKQADRVYIGAMLSGKGKFYFDDFKLYIKKGKKDIEIPLTNNGFENDSISPWIVTNFKDKSKIKLTSEKFNTGTQSLVIDNLSAVSEAYGNNSKTGKYAEVNGIKLYYEIYGSGETLLLLHGNNESIASFQNQIPELSKKYKVIALDSRGQGNSTADTNRLTYELFASDVNSFLDYLKIKKTHVLGWSDGGNIALILAILYPDKVKTIASMAAVLYNDHRSVPDEINVLLRKQLSEMQQNGVAKTDINYRLKELLLSEPNVDPDSLMKITAPVLIMAGENDIVKEQHTKLIAAKIPNAALKIFKKTGHEAPNDIPEEFNKVVLEFFEKNK